MPSFPSTALTPENVKMTFREPVVSEAVNLRMMGVPRGIYRGFIPSATPGSLVLTLGVDPVGGYSNLKVGTLANVQVDIFTEASIELDFAGHTRFPVYVIARASYAQGQVTQARVFTRSSGPVGPQEVALCLVDRPVNDLVVDTTVPGRRQPPLAFQGQAFGYMQRGASDDIAFAQSVTTEVITARNDIKNPGPPPGAQRLADRCALDFAADFLADQLGLRQVVMAGNSVLVGTAAATANVSSSFAELLREIEPARTIEPFGSEVVEGAVHDPDDRAIVALVDDSDGQRPVDAARHPLYGRLEYLTGVLTGTMSFVQAATTVTGVGTLFLTELEDGDIILGDDGLYYEVASRTSNLLLELSFAYLNTTALGVGSSFRRWTVRFYSRATGAEVATSIVTPLNMRIFFSAFWRTDRSIYDATTLLRRTGERPVLPEATNAVRGRIKVAIAGGKAAAIFAVNAAGAPIAGGPNFHTLNFAAVNASVSNVGGGVANIIVPGNPGPPGPGSTQGPQGAPGAPGPGANLLNAFEKSGSFGPGGTHSHSVNFAGATPALPTTLIHAVAGIAQYKAGNWQTGEQWEITFFNKAGTTATMGIELDNPAPSGPNQAVTKGYLGASI